MSHLSGLELHDAAYGFAEPPPHLAGCDRCRKGLASIESERRAFEEIFRARRRPFNWSWAAAVVFLGVVAAIVFYPRNEKPVPSSQQETLASLVERFVNGDETARAKILAAGPIAMHELLPHRRDPRVRGLRDEIRRAEAAPGEFVMLDPTLGALDQEVKGLDALEEVSEKHGADFAYRYGITLIAKAERLWLKEPIRVPPLSDADRARAKALLPKLGAEMADDRDDAQKDLRAMGSAVIPVLEEGFASSDPEIAGRCRTLAALLQPRSTVAFGTPAAVASPRFEEFQKRLMTMKLQDLALSGTLKLMLVGQGTVLEGIPEARISVDAQNVSSAAILSVLTQAYGLDYVLEGGEPVIGPREEILKRVK